jgi:choline-sulfatase
MPTLLEFANEPPVHGLPGADLVAIANDEKAGHGNSRAVFSEYHANGSVHARYMIRSGPWKYNYYVNDRPELFNLEEDPDETTDRWDDPAVSSVRGELDAALHRIVDPEAVDAEAKKNQSSTGTRRSHLPRGRLPDREAADR